MTEHSGTPRHLSATCVQHTAHKLRKPNAYMYMQLLAVWCLYIDLFGAVYWPISNSLHDVSPLGVVYER